jgi:hypothetical protein
MAIEPIAIALSWPAGETGLSRRLGEGAPIPDYAHCDERFLYVNLPRRSPPFSDRFCSKFAVRRRSVERAVELNR